MALIKGVCKNFGECDLADNKEIQEAEKSNFVCEECGKPLHAIDGGGHKSGGGKGSNGKLIALIAGVVAAVGVVGGGIYTLIDKLGGGKKPTVIKLENNKLQMKVGETIVLTPKVEPEGTKATFNFKPSKSSKDLIKVTAGGEVTALKKGEAVIRIKCEESPDISKICKITIVEDSLKTDGGDGPKPDDKVVLIQKITLANPSVVLAEGQSAEVSLSVEPENFTEQILISSSDESVAELVIDEGKIVAKKAGTAVITIKGEQSSVAASINVTVKAKPIPTDGGGGKPGGTGGGYGYGTAKLSYGTYKGELKNGQPHGHGTVTFTTTRRIVSTQDYIAHPGDRYEGEWRNGVIAGGLGYWYHDGETTGIRP